MHIGSRVINGGWWNETLASKIHPNSAYTLERLISNVFYYFWDVIFNIFAFFQLIKDIFIRLFRRLWGIIDYFVFYNNQNFFKRWLFSLKLIRTSAQILVKPLNQLSWFFTTGMLVREFNFKKYQKEFRNLFWIFLDVHWKMVTLRK